MENQGVGENERDTHFTEFAKLQLEGIFKRFGSSIDTDEDQEKEWRLFLAQCAYDLVGHTMDHLSSYAYDVATEERHLWECIPDLTTWPN